MALAEQLLSALGPRPRAKLDGVDGLEALLQQRWSEARAEWPQLELAPAAWVEHLARHLPPSDPMKGLEVLHADFYLATAIKQGDGSAIDLFVERFEPVLRAATRKLEPHRADELVSRVLERLLVADHGEPRLATYAGRAPLRIWLKASAVHQLIDASRSTSIEEELSEQLRTALHREVLSPELRALQADAQLHFFTALRQAFMSLDPRERAVLRLHTIDHATIDDLGRLYAVHRTTAFRWVEQARLELEKRTRMLLKQRLSLDSTQVKSLLRALPDQLEASLGGVFVRSR